MDRLVRLKAVVRQIYGGRSLMPGDPYPDPVPERAAIGLIRNHFAEEVSADEPVQKRVYRRRDMRAEK